MRRTRIRRKGHLALAVSGLALTALSACHLVSYGCPQAGGYSGVLFEDIGAALSVPARMPAVTPEPASSPEPAEGPTYRAVGCADGVCAEVQGAYREDLMWLHVVLDGVTAPTTVTATLTVTDVGTGDVVLDVSTPAELVLWQPGDPRCSPAAYRARLQLTPEGKLVQVANNLPPAHRELQARLPVPWTTATSG